MRGHARRDRDRSRIFGVGMGLLALAGLPACAQFSGPPSELEQIVVTQQQQIQLQARALEALRREVAGLREAVTASTGPVPTDLRVAPDDIGRVAATGELATSRGAGPDKPEAASAPQASEAPTEDAKTAEASEASSTATANAAEAESQAEKTSEERATEVAGETGETPMQKRERELEDSIPLRAGGVLLPPGRLQIDPQIRYAYSSVNRLEITGYTILPAITLGRIDITKRDTSSFTASIGARYGLFSWLELDLGVPFIAGWSRTKLSPTTTSSEDLVRSVKATGYNIGDVRFGVRAQLNKGTEKIPSFVAGLSARFPTGTDPYDMKRTEGPEANLYSVEKELPTGSGFFSLTPTISFVYPTEPGVVFGNVRYTWNIARDVSALQPRADPDLPAVPYGRVDAGDVIGASLGFGLSLNESLSVLFSYDHSYVFRTTQNGHVIPGSTPLQIGTLGLGGTWRTSPRTSYSLFLGIGVTDDAPDVSIGLRVPVTFDLFR
ncbi:MAG: transporter [Myxococcota bacterium]|nr:transporter [Myxococcota bacterium]